MKWFFVLPLLVIVHGQTDPRPLFPKLAENTGARYTIESPSPYLGFGATSLEAGETFPPNATLHGDRIWRLAFSVKVDDFTSFTILDSYSTPWYQNTSHIWLEGAGLNGYSKMKKKEEGNLIVPAWTIIGQVKDGKLVGLVWDDISPCLGCPNSCVDGFCAIPKTDCGLNGITCDLKIYIGWIGTDSKGNYMTSAGRRLSQFRNYSLKAAFDTAYKTYKSEIPAEMQAGN